MSKNTLIRPNRKVGLDKKPNLEFSVNKMYFTRDPQRTDRLLQVL